MKHEYIWEVYEWQHNKDFAAGELEIMASVQHWPVDINKSCKYKNFLIESMSIFRHSDVVCR